MVEPRRRLKVCLFEVEALGRKEGRSLSKDDPTSLKFNEVLAPSIVTLKACLGLSCPPN